jgi:predicted AlkP superfamily pyrophosphatase or phosphodiesterase
MLMPRDLINSGYNQVYNKKAVQIGYSDLKSLFNFILNLIKNQPGKKYIVGYIPDFDSIAHDKGINSEDTASYFKKLDAEISQFIDQKNALGNNSKVITIADHGLIDTDMNHTILLENHPELAQTLALPLCGEPRLSFCYVRPSKVTQFESYLSSHFEQYCSWMKGDEFINKNLLGLFTPHPRITDRVGDYVLFMKENYILKDQLLGEQRRDLIGNHGGVSEDEIYVPLIIF